MQPKVVCFGETLWDIFPDKKVIGGAPLNVALRLHSLGAESSIISRVGNDQDGKGILDYLKKESFDDHLIQIDKELQTGNVQVHLDKMNTATYTISEPVAWDRISIEEAHIERIAQSDAFIFGSLSCRNSISRNTLFNYLSHAKFKVFDANLRPPNYQIKTVIKLMLEADMIKLNDEELEELITFYQISSKSIEGQIIDLSKKTTTPIMCITLGAKGAILYAEGKFYKNSGYKVTVKDTVGAGDSFLASLVFQLVQTKPFQKALDTSCAMGSLVASKKGGNAYVSVQEVENLQNSDK
jgi:fructokinase